MYVHTGRDQCWRIEMQARFNKDEILKKISYHSSATAAKIDMDSSRVRVSSTSSANDSEISHFKTTLFRSPVIKKISPAHSSLSWMAAEHVYVPLPLLRVRSTGFFGVTLHALYTIRRHGIYAFIPHQLQGDGKHCHCHAWMDHMLVCNMYSKKIYCRTASSEGDTTTTDL